MHGQPALPPGFPHLPYVNPDAPKGGRLVLGVQGTFDSMNLFIARGNVPEFTFPHVVQPLMMRSLDEPFTLYGLVAQSLETPPDQRSAIFHLNPAARFSDGQPITSADVAFTFQLLKDKGRPAQRTTYRRVAAVETPDPLTVRFVFAEANERELPLLLALMPVLARHAVAPETFDQPTFRVPLGSGPYVLADLDPGKSFTLRRNPNFWANDLPILRGLYNFDEIRLDFYRDPGTLFEAFKSGLFDYRVETDPTRWLEGYDVPAVRDGRIVRKSLRFEAPRGMSGFVFNTRRADLADVRVREALTLAFDFEWLNRNLHQGVFTRTRSFFDQSELASTGRPASPEERALLGADIQLVRPTILDGTWTPPVSDGSGRDRARMRAALDLLQEAGYRLTNGVMRRQSNSEALTFEILVRSRDEERIALAFADGLRPLGIMPSIRLADSSLYWRRLRVFDFDVMLWSYAVSASPGNEQANRWSSAAAEREASLNYAGVRSPAIDRLIDAVLAAETREAFVHAVRALDRLLLSGAYVLPLYHLPDRWIAHAAWLRHPDRLPRFDLTLDAWWRDPQHKAAPSTERGQP
jgi:peptide/nickel transport system substrate-binding protein